MMAQYVEIKTANPDSLLFYRMGDFYELFFGDAEEASRALGITLTKRGKHNGEDIPMCGVPVHAADDYLQKLIALGFRVAVCEQLEDPQEAKKRGSKAVVKRDVVRLVTPGTLTEETLLDANQSNFLAALARTRAGIEGALALAWTDLSTGAFHVLNSSLMTIEADLTRVDPVELIVSDSLYGDPALAEILNRFKGAVVPQPGAFFESTTSEDRLSRFFNVASLEAFGTFTREEKMASAAIVSYVEKTQLGERPALSPPSREASDGVMLIDPATRANLEINKTLSGERRGSLLSSISNTVTGAGTRLLAERLSSPSMNVDTINARLNAVAWFLEEPECGNNARDMLKSVPDMVRCLARVAMSRAGPRDVASIAKGIRGAISLCKVLDDENRSGPPLPDLLANALQTLQSAPTEMIEELERALADELPNLKRDGGFIRKAYDPKLDEIRQLRDESRRIIAGLQVQYADLAGVKALKIKHNNVLGYFVEVTAQHSGRMMSEPLNETFIHRQTLANVVRFTTTELSNLQTGIINAAEQALSLEFAHFDRFESAIIDKSDQIKTIAAALAEIDVASANAALAEKREYCRPQVDETLRFDIVGGRHPVVEEALRSTREDRFVANNCSLANDSDEGLIWLITGPNMAGKSTFLRQNALVTIMAQAGFYVPATSAHIGLVDRLFSRVGASDDLARGRSTFMVEMVETAAILNQAGERSLVILDEIGRGTATFDGLSIAWAAIEHLHQINRSRGIFATHYHELTSLSDVLKRLFNATVKVSEWKGDVIFLHEIVPGAADRSYGIQVAKLAGLPKAVIQRAKEVLGQLEAADRQNPATLIDDLPLFSAVQNQRETNTEDNATDKVHEILKSANPDDLSPKEALELLYRLKMEANANTN